VTTVGKSKCPRPYTTRIKIDGWGERVDLVKKSSQ
jgi:hypothetical protein